MSSSAVQERVIDMGADYRQLALKHHGQTAIVYALLSISIELHGIRSSLCEIETDNRGHSVKA